MNRIEFQLLAEIRLKEAEALLAARLWDGAYYLAGYAVECGLKACIAKRTLAEDFPPGKDIIAKIYSHSFEELIQVAGLKPARDATSAAEPLFDANWKTAVKWKEDARYRRWSQVEAERLFRAVSDTPHGVLTWLRTHF
jgi:hypothetical protein